ncbi:MAG: hypothetical protein WBN50_09025 [Lutimonas sp.]
MNKISVSVFLALLGLLLMQLGASLFSITIAVSTLVESPPESLAMTQGEFPYDSSAFWDVYPNILGSVFLIALILNWRTKFKKWVLISFGLYIVMALFAIFIFEPAQANVLNNNGAASQDLKHDAAMWYMYDWILFSIASAAAIALLIPVFKQLNESR